jgi:hypothetical protein
LSQEKLVDLRTADYKARTKSLVEKIIQTRRMTKAQLEEYYEISDKLGVEPSFDGEFEKYWQLACWDAGEELQLNETASNSLLKSGETAYFSGVTSWAQMKTIKTRAGSKGFSASFRIVKGVSYRIGTVRPVYTSHDALVDIADGQITVTNKRVIFEGSPKSVAILHSRIIDIEAYVDGIHILKNSGKNDFFRLSQTDAEFCSMLVEHFHSA